MEVKNIYNYKGEDKKISDLFNEAEIAQLKRTQDLVNAAGFGDIDMTMLTLIERQVSEQKFYRVDPTKFIPIDTTQGGWNDYITVLRTYSNAEGDISTWERGLDADNARRGQVGVKMDSESLKVHNLSKMISWSLFELNQAAQTGVWNIVTEKERARKLDHDLALQSALLRGDETHKGLLNQTEVVVDSSLLSKPISKMTAAEFKTFLGSFIYTYFKATEFTAMPDTLVVPMSDWTALNAKVDETYSLMGQTMLGRLREIFRETTGNGNADILPLVYCEAEFQADKSKARYVLYRRSSDCIRAYNPISYNVVQGMTVDGMNYQNTAYSRISDVFVNRPKEMIYLDCTVA